MGASVAYHLQELGIQTTLLEKSKLTSGTTWHSAGMLWRLRPSYVDIELHSYSRDMAIKLGKETNYESWSENGGLFLANSPQRLMEYKRLKEIGSYYNIPSRILTPDEVNTQYITHTFPHS